jgi:hypothetical protein
MGLKKVWRRLTLLLATLVLHSSASGATFGQLGEHLDKAKDTEFFRWFHLEQTYLNRAGAQTVVAFKPSGEKFRALVTLNATTDGQDRLQALELVLARVFVDDPGDGVFARDIVKSFLLAVVTGRGDQGLNDLISEIQYPLFHGPGVIGRTPPADVKLPEAPTLCYQVYLGRQTACTLDLADRRLRLENRRVGETPSLIVEIRPR